jgi:hypothetical protein
MIKILITGGNGNIAKMIKKNLSAYYDITNLSRTELNILDVKAIELYLENNIFDILVHTPINGGRRTKTENGDVTHFNILMFENMVLFVQIFAEHRLCSSLRYLMKDQYYTELSRIYALPE